MGMSSPLRIGTPTSDAEGEEEDEVIFVGAAGAAGMEDFFFVKPAFFASVSVLLFFSYPLRVGTPTSDAEEEEDEVIFVGAAGTGMNAKCL